MSTGEDGSFAIALQLPHVFLPGSSPVENAEVLQILVETLISIDRIYLRQRKGKIGPLYKAGIRYQLTDDWMPTPSLYYAGYGDCKSLTAARIAELREDGRVAKPVFRFSPDGMMYHILIMTGVNSFEDPSKACGMDASEWSYFPQ